MVLFPSKLEIGKLTLFCGAPKRFAKSCVTIFDMLPESKTARAWIQNFLLNDSKPKLLLWVELRFCSYWYKRGKRLYFPENCETPLRWG
ncbi:hypothetical protein TNIN_267201 [Trichonephila inaurata madagascariensis]|uniref:Uncharacterized protein n=1 Tax=Trichonephila inaurata madagascariensis TaxID=2747483 RepID=A0A8X6MB37_9ARAC|nr:hypothetical protein TNIN_267201 [Trichonephila inaurata madagascariensis]